ncbi:MAG: cation diffusion facilitator family transporter [bacterium]|nr:cation diffusion facilitator family transporter [bacterium]
MDSAAHDEQRALRLSVYGNLGMGTMGLIFAWWTASDAIMLDGFFSMLGFGMAILSLKVARLTRTPFDERFNFGYFSFEPMLNTAKGMIIVVLCGFALWSAVDSVLGGGRDLQAGGAALYALVAVAGCFGIGFTQKRAAKRTRSPLLEVDAKNWIVDGYMSLVVAAAFGAAMLMAGTSFEAYIPFVDPVLVIVMVLLMLPIPFKIIARGAGELLLAAPDDKTQFAVSSRVEAILDDADLERHVFRMVRIGRVFWLVGNVFVPESHQLQTLGEFDAVKQRILDSAREVEPEIEVDIVFTGIEEWVY